MTSACFFMTAHTPTSLAGQPGVSYGMVLTDEVMKQLCHMVLFKRFLRDSGKAGRNEILRNQKLPPSKTTHANPADAIVIADRADVPSEIGVEVIRGVAIENHRRPEATAAANAS